MIRNKIHVNMPTAKCRRKKDYGERTKFSKCGDRIRMCISHYNLMDGVAFNLVGYSAWYPWLGVCDLLCNQIYLNTCLMKLPGGSRKDKGT